MIQHDKQFVRAAEAELRAAARSRPAADPGELERLLIAQDRNGTNAPAGLRRLTAQVRGVARAHRLPAHDVEDVVQSTWLRLLEKRNSIREPGAVGAWMNTAARRESLRALREAGRAVATDPAELVDQAVAPGTDAAPATREAEQALAAAIDALPRRQRRLMRMLLEEPAPSYAQVARALGMPIGSIGPTRARAIERLRSDGRLMSALEQPES
jgi:RNA polymerase sigma factor (sigma-70 family)